MNGKKESKDDGKALKHGEKEREEREGGIKT